MRLSALLATFLVATSFVSAKQYRINTMAETALPLGAIYSNGTHSTLTSQRAAEEAEGTYAPTVFDPATLVSKGLVRVGKDRVPVGANKAPTRDAVRKGAKQPTKEPGFNLYYEMHGKGERKVVFLMGLNNSCFGWLPQVEHFTKDDRYSVIVLDNRGYGNTDTPGGPYSTSAMAQDVLDLFDSPQVNWTKSRQIHVVGVSMGGMIALELGKMVPERIASLGLISTTSGQSRGEKNLFVSLPPLSGIKTITRVLGGRILGMDTDEYRVERVAELLFPPEWLDKKSKTDAKGRTNREATIEMFEWRFGFTRRPTLYGAMAQIRAVITHRVTITELTKINKDIPAITILTGDDDNLVNPGNSVHLAQHMTRATYTKFEGAGHALPAQIPQDVAETLTRNIDLAHERLAEGSWA